MKYNRFYGTFLVLISMFMIKQNSFAMDNSDVFNTKITLNQKEFLEVVPIKTRGNKILLRASINNKPFQFILDTGSPTVITKQVATELGLNVVGKNIGKDANGTSVEMALAIADNISFGKVSFNNVPVFIFDGSQLPLSSCYLDGGVIGSEILPLAKWQIDFKHKQLIITNDLDKLKHVKKASRATLKSFGYPHAPILAHKLNGEFSDHAMFDTGNSELIQLNKLAYDELIKRGLLDGKITTAFGSFGESAGGGGKNSPYSQFRLEELAIGNLKLDAIDVWTRPIVPTLIGAKILESHIVTLDYAGKQIYFQPFTESELSDDSFGFRSNFEDGKLRISFLTHDSPLAKAGVKVGDQILTINGDNLANISEKTLCSTIEKISAAVRAEKIDLSVLHKDKASHFSLTKQATSL